MGGKEIDVGLIEKLGIGWENAGVALVKTEVCF
jgi:hypothetical protein